MRRSEVHGLLGTPLREERGAGGPLLEYAICGAAVESIGFWVSLDDEDRVNTLHVKHCRLIADDYAIYKARMGEPVYEHPDCSRIFGKRH